MRLKTIIGNPFLSLFLLFNLYFYFIFDSAIYYHLHQPSFFFDEIFFTEFLSFPGGLFEWICLFFFQFLYFNLIGSLIFSAISTAIFFFIYRFIREFAKSESVFIFAFLPVSLLLILQNQYNFSLIIPAKYLFSLICLFVYFKISHKYKTIFILLSGFIYYILGGGFFLLYSVLCIFSELFFSKSTMRFIRIGIFFFISFLLPYIAARYFFVISLKEAYFYIVPYEFFYEPFLFEPDFLFYLFLLSLPILMAIIFIYVKFIEGKLAIYQKELSGPFVQLIIIVFCALILVFSFNQEQKNRIQIDFLAQQEKWQELLTLSRQIEKYNRMVNFNTNWALYHSGQLLDYLFSYSQLLGGDGLFIHRIMNSQTAVLASELYLDLGHVDASQLMAYEGQTKERYNPLILKRLALTNIINGNFLTARKFIAILKKSLLHRRWAEQNEKYLFNPSSAENDPYIQLKRRQRPRADFFIDKNRPDRDLILLLTEDDSNKMAFEYLMAFYLLELRLGDLAPYLERFKDFGYGKFPRHIEESIVLMKTLSAAKPMVELAKFTVSDETIDKFSQFNRILFQNRTNNARAKLLLEKNFGDTYWYYVRFTNPKITKMTLKEGKINEDLY